MPLEDSEHAAGARLLAQDKQAILESSLDCIVVMDDVGCIREWNPAAERTFGYTREEALGRKLGDLIVPEELREQHEQGLARAARTGESRIMGQRLRLPAQRRDGSTFTAEVTITKIDRGGRLIFTGTIRDITDTVQAEEELRAAEERYRRLVEQLPLTTYQSDASGEILHISSQIEHLLGYAIEEWLSRGRSFYDECVHPEDLTRVQGEATSARIHSTFSRSEYRMIRSDGGIVWVLDEMAPAGEPDGSVTWRGFLLDITERKQLEEQLRQSQKLEAVGQLAGGIAHDFNNLLLAIAGYSDLLREAITFDDELRVYADEIVKATERAANLTRQLLAYSRKQTLSPKILDLNAIVRDLGGMLPRVIGEHVELVTELADELDTVKADQGQIEQVIINLAINARDAMPGGGTLTIATAEVELGKEQAAEFAIPAGRYVRLSLSDTGCGIDSETQGHLFEPFFTTKEIGKGTGLGLATVFGIVTQSDGYVTVESEVGSGSMFSIYLTAAGAPAERPVLEAVTKEPPAGTETILVVEDESVVRDLARIALERSGYRVLEAGNGLEALAVADGHDGPIELLLTDVVMPSMGGFEVAERLALSRPGTEVLYMSGYPAGCLGDGPGVPSGSNFIAKPFELSDLPAKVREVLDGSNAPRVDRAA